MSLATVTTLGYSISGGLQAGPYTLPTLGYGIGEAEIEYPDPTTFTLLRGLHGAERELRGFSESIRQLKGRPA